MNPSPRIQTVSWGRVWVAGQAKPYKDAKLFPGGARAWDWRETGTRHSPGVQPADVKELVERGAQVVVLSRGFQKRLGVQEETLAYLAERGIPVEVLETGAAVERYNELCDEAPVGALIHSTC
jgi:hypothetical protein